MAEKYDPVACRILYEAVRDFFKDPAVMADFEQWRSKKRKEEEKCTDPNAQ